MKKADTTYETKIVDCPSCGGKGELVTYNYSGDRNSTGNPYMLHKCHTCNGKGKLEKMTIVTEIFKIIN